MAEKKEKKEKLLDKPFKLKELIMMNILSFETKAWAYMDFIAHPETQKHTKDLKEARIAIDSIDALFKVIEPELDSTEKKDIQTRLTNLRQNFARKD